jgi:hypothetical protein
VIIDPYSPAARHLSDYIGAVARAMGISAEATECELSDTATAYLALTRRLPSFPDRDLMLIWSECDGWAVAVETDPGEAPIVIAYFGDDILPEPHAIARFVDDLVAGNHPGQPDPPSSRPADRDNLHSRLARHGAQRNGR